MEDRLKVFYDGLCVVCSKEIEHYQRQSGSEHIRFVDITLAEFNAETEGLDPFLVHKVMHVKTASGDFRTGVDAFVAIWEQLPRYAPLAKVARYRLVQGGLQIGYQLFVKVRPYLPRKTRECANSPYCEMKENV